MFLSGHQLQQRVVQQWLRGSLRARSDGRPSPDSGRLSLFFACVLCWVMLAGTIANGQTYTDMHDFKCGAEGCRPDYPAVLAQGRDGNLYGTTMAGGTGNAGTVFMITPSGTLTTIYSFSGPDGSLPLGGLTLGTDGNFYGTTNSGGAANGGTIFKITAAGTLTTLHSFSGSDGASPHGAPVFGKNGQMYGTTCSQFGPWTGYSITTAGKFKLLTSSIPPCPYGGLILGSDGDFYGASQVGGALSQGTVFRMSPAGAVKILYSFDNAHGAYVYSPVVQANDGYLYGTTTAGGSGQGGVIFKMTTAGKKFTLLHQFDAAGVDDGSSPTAGLAAASDGKFYGATSGGENSGHAPNGALFQIDGAANYAMEYAFDGQHGGEAQATPMQHTNGTIYGVTQSGGAFSNGVVYSFDMGLPRSVVLMTRWGSAGQTVEILGTGLTGTTSVDFGSGAATFNVVSDTYMTAVVPSQGMADFVTVTTPGGAVKSSQVFYLTPVISGITPTSGPAGTVVTITGSGLKGATQVTFGGVKATSFTVNSGTQITATVPSGAKSGKVAVKTAGGSATGKTAFTVTN